jgi:hypothetical protein
VKQVFIEDQISQELIPYIQMVSYLKSSTINDVSAAGLRGKIFENWNFDLSTYGKTDSITIFKTLQMRL